MNGKISRNHCPILLLGHVLILICFTSALCTGGQSSGHVDLREPASLLTVTTYVPITSQVTVSSGKAVKAQNAYLSHGNEHFQKEEYDKAIQEYSKAIALKLECYECYLNRGLAYYMKEQYDKALEDYDKGITVNAHAPGLFLNRGNVHYRRREFERAVSDYTEAIRIDPAFAQSAYTARAFIYYGERKYDEAIDDYRKALTIRMADVGVLARRLEALKSEGVSNDVLKKLKSLGNHGKLKEEKFVEYLKGILGEEHAIKYRSVFMKYAMGQNITRIYNNLGVMYLKKRDLETAISNFDLAILLDANTAEIYYNRAIAFLYLSKGQDSRFDADMNKAVRLNPQLGHLRDPITLFVFEVP